MDHPAEPVWAGPAATWLQPEIYDEIVGTLWAALPAPPGETATQRTHRRRFVFAQMAAFAPANADEAEIAARHIAANAHAELCQRLAIDHARDRPMATKLLTQCTSMMREARSLARLLTRVQAARRKRAADPVARERDAIAERRALTLMTEALDELLGSLAPAPTPAAARTSAPLELAKPKIIIAGADKDEIGAMLSAAGMIRLPRGALQSDDADSSGDAHRQYGAAPRPRVLH